jgi:hypothetical protein
MKRGKIPLLEQVSFCALRSQKRGDVVHFLGPKNEPQMLVSMQAERATV